MNVSDSERIAGLLEKNAFSPASNANEADLIVVVMCSIRQTAVDRVYGQIKNFKKLKKKNPKLKIILTGCILKSDFKKIKEKQEYDYILPIKTLSSWNKILKQKQYTNLPRTRDNSSCDYLKIKPEYVSKFSAFIPIIIGCNNFCSYCVVPYTRGPEISRPAQGIIKEIKQLAYEGYKEIWLIGENVNSYKYKEMNFAKLLKTIDKIPGDFWIRFTSSHPKDFSSELIDIIAKANKITKYISLPVQSGDDKILKKMNRPYTIKQYKNIIKKIRKKIPDVMLSTDVIVGFPEETKKQFENTIKLFKEIKPDMAYVAQYSPRKGTKAFEMGDTIPQKEKIRRDKAITEVLKQTALFNNKKYIGKQVEMLVEYERKGYLIGKTKNYKTIKISLPKNQKQANLIGKIIKVKVISAIPWGLKAKLIE
jgi:tRNA-2-methylthio-N6-dimethylallyladenosine synthase